MSLLREFCAENMEHVAQAVRAGATRVELCDNLAVGGTTPGFGVIRAAVAFGEEHGARIMCMARPRGGDFVYDDGEAAMMLDDIALARALGADGVVFGCLSESGAGRLEVDWPRTARFVAQAKGRARNPLKGLEFCDGIEGEARDAPVQVTFHMAFDALDIDHQLDAVAALADMGVDRILTHGGAAGTPIEDGLPHLARLIEQAAGRITILPGGGITHENAGRIAAALGVQEVHGTRIVALG